MKIRKYVVEVYKVSGNLLVEKLYFDNEKLALSFYEVRESDNRYFKYKYIGEVLFEAFCAHCEKEISEGDDYLKIDEETRYCNECYQENVTYYYTVGGEVVADENYGSELYDSDDKEVWV